MSVFFSETIYQHDDRLGERRETTVCFVFVRSSYELTLRVFQQHFIIRWSKARRQG